MISEQPLVSVLMTSYNREKYIGEAIGSVLASTYTNFELIIVDDGSKDATVDIADKYAAKDERVKVFMNTTNLGDYPNRNKAASYANGKYLKYVDADDLIYPWGLAILVDCMERFPGAGWGLCSLIQIVQKPYPFQLNSKEAYEHHYLGPGLFHKAPLSAIFKKEAFLKTGGFSNIRMAGDFEMWNRMALDFPVVLMPDGIVWYREHDSQEINVIRKFILVYENISLQYLNNINCPLSKEQVKNVLKKKRRKMLKTMIINLMNFRFSASFDNLKIWRFYFGK